MGVVAAVVAVVAFWFSYPAGKSQPLKTRAYWLLITSVLAIPSASLAVYYAHIFPETKWYYEFRSWPGTEFLVVIVGIAGGVFASVLPRCILILPLTGVVLLAIIPAIKPFIGPIPDDSISSLWDGDVCRQSIPSTCGAASTATVLRAFDIDATEAEIAREAHSCASGTEAWYMARVLRSRACAVRFHVAAGFEPKMALPAIVGVRLGTVGHFIAILSCDGGQYLVGDPLVGPRTFSEKALRRRYEFTGFFMSVSIPRE